MTLQTIFSGILGMIFSTAVIWFASTLGKNFLRIDFMESKLGQGGSVIFLRIFGVILFFISILMFFGQFQISTNPQANQDQAEDQIEINIPANPFNKDRRDPL